MAAILWQLICVLPELNPSSTINEAQLRAIGELLRDHLLAHKDSTDVRPCAAAALGVLATRDEAMARKFAEEAGVDKSNRKMMTDAIKLAISNGTNALPERLVGPEHAE